MRHEEIQLGTAVIIAARKDLFEVGTIIGFGTLRNFPLDDRWVYDGGPVTIQFADRCAEIASIHIVRRASPLERLAGTAE